MPMPAHFLLLLLLLFGDPGTGLSRKICKAGPVFGCLNTALSKVKKNQMEDVPLLSKKSFHYLPSQDPSSREEKEEEEGNLDKDKRTFTGSGSGGGAGSARYKYLLQAQHKGKLHQDKGKSDQRTKFTLSLDVPTNIMNILFNIAKAKNLRAKAAANAHLMAQIGRKK
ncbi:PREDICTED: urocortin-3 [Chinchilla lanigera]|uniref:urocortin-3 n=1 Tax=Chinchilla lanigera TaxID=34839 RepID=UPI00038EAAD2|nr:PREDICTED: urocortin-3 [Chinchilla lanigera]